MLPAETRKLAAIMFTDMVGFSRQMGADGDEEHNCWSRRIARKTREKGQPLAFIEIQRLAPARSRLVEPQLRLEAAS